MTSSEDPVKEFKLVLVGDARVGKTALMERYSDGQGNNPNENPLKRLRYDATIKAKVYSVIVNTDKGHVKFNVWDIPGKADFFSGRQERDEYYSQADCAILMFDVTCRISYLNIPYWYRVITEFSGNIPITLVGNKVDIKDRKIKGRHITPYLIRRLKFLEYYDMSVKSCYNIEKPFQLLANDLMSDWVVPVPSLQELCRHKLLMAMTVENASDIFHTADKYYLVSLRMEVLGFILKNFKAVSKTVTFKNMARSNIELFLEIIERHAEHLP